MAYVTPYGPERELSKALRLANRMFTRRTIHRVPCDWLHPYRPPSLTLNANYRQLCDDCGRECTGNRCRECFQKHARAKYAAKVRAEDKRVSANEKAFYNVIQSKGFAMSKKLQVTPITRSTSGLRTALFEEMEALRAGTSNAQRARSVAMMANSILQSVQVEIEYHKYVNANKGHIDGDKKVVTLGTDISLAA